MPKLSIIIPIFNSQKWLNKNIESVLKQDFQDFELILIDDGSTDASSMICQAFALRSNKIIVVSKINAGVSVARNLGLSISSGKFIGFVDSDDEITSSMFASLIQLIEKHNTDIVMCDTMSVFSDGSILMNDTITQLPGDKMLYKSDWTPDLLREMAGSVYRCIYRREELFLNDNNILFPEGLKISEDRIFNIKAMGKANSLFYTKKPYYKRYIIDGSAVHSYHKDYYGTVKSAFAFSSEAIKTYWTEEFQYCPRIQFAEGAMSAVKNVCRKNARMPFWERFKVIRKICNDEDLQTELEQIPYDSLDVLALMIRFKMALLISTQGSWIYSFGRRVLRKLYHI